MMCGAIGGTNGTGRGVSAFVARNAATDRASAGADPVMICQMMGDAQLETIRRRYFASHLDHIQAAVNRLVIAP